ncbi:MAG: efflux RND transporter permease subunit, partial [Pseudomonadales bacterium]|nr:efflux RND transporter permease subunit [Pseudomonadales bacterium]
TVTLTFLLNTLATFIVATVIPVAVISTFFAFYVLDFSINMLTMMALSVSIGLLVDDAIVVLESIYRRVEEGDDPDEAASRGTARVGTAVIAGSLSIMAVFVPIAFMEGIVGRFFFQYGLTIVFAVGISLLVSLTLTPMLCSQLLKQSKPPGGLFLLIENVYQWVERIYQSLLAFSLRHRWLITGGALVAVMAGVQLASEIPIAFSPKTDRSEFTATVEMPLGTGIAESREVGRQVSEAIKDVPHVQHVFMSIGGGPVSRTNEINFYIATTHKSDRDRNFELIMDDVRNLIQKEAPGAKATQLAEVPWVGAGGGSFLNDVMVVIQGSDLKVLEQISDDLLARM